jgi:hypothetical protein
LPAAVFGAVEEGGEQIEQFFLGCSIEMRHDGSPFQGCSAFRFISNKGSADFARE